MVKLHRQQNMEYNEIGKITLRDYSEGTIIINNDGTIKKLYKLKDGSENVIVFTIHVKESSISEYI